MEKVKVTREQAEAIEFLRGTEAWTDRLILETVFNPDISFGGEKSIVLNEIDPMVLAKALFNGYEVEPEFKVGDWVVNDSTGVIKFIEDEKVSNFLTKEYINRHNIRHATPSEIAAEKERRWWSKLGREVNEYYVGDIIFYSQTRRYHRITGKYDGYITNEFGDRCEVDKLKLVCPAEKRLDVKTNE